MPVLTAEQASTYERDGFILLESFLPTSVSQPLLDAVGHGALVVLDADGNRQHVNTWTWCGDDLIGRLPRAEPLVSLAAALIDSDVYHWHSKLSWKPPGSAGTWDWHQDYAFWLEEDVRRPAMTTIGIALDHHDQTNGCLRVIPGSHHLGPIAHPALGAGRTADPAIVDELVDRVAVVDVTLKPGDAIAFDCNLLHGSGPNTSDRPRTFVHCSYNATDNGAGSPLIDGHQAHEMEIVSAAALAPGAWASVCDDTQFIRPENTGYGGRSGYQVLSAE